MRAFCSASVFGPYAQDDEFGSRAINPMELYHNQVTRAQGSFSLRMFHRSWGIMMIQENISAPCTVLDFPTREAFARELTRTAVRRRRHLLDHRECGQGREKCAAWCGSFRPTSVIVVGGHVAAIPGIEKMIDADHIVRGEGISWMRRYLGEDENAPIRHPTIVSGLETRIMGIRLAGPQGRDGGDDYSVGGLPDGMQLLHDVGVFRRQGKVLSISTRPAMSCLK